MSEVIPYGKGHVFKYPLVSAADATLYKTAATLAAGDAMLRTNAQGLTNLTAKYAAFTSGGGASISIPQRGDILSDSAAGTSFAIVIEVVIVSGVWSSGTAAGFVFADSTSGDAFGAETVDNDSSAEDDVLTLSADFTVGYGVREASGGLYLFPVTSTEAQCADAEIVMVDAAGGPEWYATTFPFKTEGHPSAYYTNNCIASVIGKSDGSQAVDYVMLNAAPQFTPRAGNFFICEKHRQTPMIGQIASYSTPGGNWVIVPQDDLPAAIDNTWTVSVFLDASSYRAHLISVAGVTLGLAGTGGQEIGAA